MLKGNLFRAGNLEALPRFYGLNEAGCLLQRFMRACVQPGITTSKPFKGQTAVFKEPSVQIGNFQLTPG